MACLILLVIIAIFSYVDPLLSFFNATALEGGRSVMLTWDLVYSGSGMRKLTTFSVKVS